MLDVTVIENKMMRCPFRTMTMVVERNIDNTLTPVQLIEFPECHGASCPFYNNKGKTQNDKCNRVTTMSYGE